MYGWVDFNSLVRWMLESGQPVPDGWLQYVTDPSLADVVADEWLCVARQPLFLTAKTLRQRAFARLVEYVQKDPEHGHSITFYHTGREKLALPMEKPPTPAELMDHCRAFEPLGRLPISLGSNNFGSNKEVVPALQDLADAVTWEASEAFVAEYYPGAQDVDPLTDEHVRWVMMALQREANREGYGQRVAQFLELPAGRQRALAERRRMWYARFGITPESWQAGTWGVWDVDDAYEWPPNDYYCRWDAVHPTSNAYIP